MRDDEISFRDTTIPVTNGWKLLLFGTLFGSTDYVAGLAISVNKATINRMVGFAPRDIEVVTTRTTSNRDSAGGVTQTATITAISDRKKDFFAMSEMLKYWQVLFYSQRFLQKVLPYVYLIVLEGSVLLAWYLTIFR